MSIVKADIRCDRQSQVHIEKYHTKIFVCDKQKQTQSCVRFVLITLIQKLWKLKWKMKCLRMDVRIVDCVQIHSMHSSSLLFDCPSSSELCFYVQEFELDDQLNSQWSLEGHS